MEGPIHTATWQDLTARVGTEIGVSDWITVDQPTIDAFADVTQDRYFLHVDPLRLFVDLDFSGSGRHVTSHRTPSRERYDC